MATLKKLLNIRNILVHELPKEKPYTLEDIPLFFEHTNQFLNALQWLSIKQRFGAEAKTQWGLNEQQLERWSHLREEFNKLRGGDAEYFSTLETPEGKLEHHWDQFCDLSAKVRAGMFSGPDTSAPSIYSGIMTDLTRWRIEEINKYLNRPEGDF